LFLKLGNLCGRSGRPFRVRLEDPRRLFCSSALFFAARRGGPSASGFPRPLTPPFFAAAGPRPKRTPQRRTGPVRLGPILRAYFPGLLVPGLAASAGHGGPPAAGSAGNPLLSPLLRLHRRYPRHIPATPASTADSFTAVPPWLDAERDYALVRFARNKNAIAGKASEAVKERDAMLFPRPSRSEVEGISGSRAQQLWYGNASTPLRLRSAWTNDEEQIRAARFFRTFLSPR